MYNSSHHIVVNEKPDRDFFAGFLRAGDHHRFTRVSTVGIQLTNNKKPPKITLPEIDSQ